MKRTWRDAACEVFYRKALKNYEKGFEFSSPKHFFLERPSGNNEEGAEVIPSILFTCDYYFFRAAFMKWLADNEVKR